MFLIFGRYLLKSYLKTFFLCISGFIAVLLITRLKEIARFIALSSSFTQAIKFILYQIPYILPITIPISSLIAAILLFKKLSSTNEITAIRASGFSIFKLISPIIAVAIWISFLNFIICSEISPKCRFKTKQIIYQESSGNPILLMQRQKLLKIKNSYIDFTKGKNESSAKNVTLITFNKRLNLINAEKIKYDQGELSGKNISIISHLPSEENNYDTLILEKQKYMQTNASNISNIMKSVNWSLNTNFFPTKQLLIKAHLSEKYKKTAIVELLRRISLSFSTFSLTFIGICFGLEISRSKSKKKLLIAAILAMVIMTSFIFGKAFKSHYFLAGSLFILPQLIIFIIALFKLKKISRGVEC